MAIMKSVITNINLSNILLSMSFTLKKTSAKFSYLSH